jgi:hypothetical protein
MSSGGGESLSHRLWQFALDRTAAERKDNQMAIARMYFSKLVPEFGLSQDQ